MQGEAERSASLDQLEVAADHAKKKTVGELNLLGSTEKLELYSLYQQGAKGDAPSRNEAPSRFNVIARAKFDAWDGKRGMNKEEARKRFVERLMEYDDSFKPDHMVGSRSSQNEGGENEPVNEEEDKNENGDASDGGAVNDGNEESITANRDSDKDLLPSFKSAVKHVRSVEFPLQSLDGKVKLKLMSLYLQATKGDCPTDAENSSSSSSSSSLSSETRPHSSFDVVELAKYSAWRQLHGMSKREAQENYVQEVMLYDPYFDPDTDDDEGEEEEEKDDADHDEDEDHQPVAKGEAESEGSEQSGNDATSSTSSASSASDVWKSIQKDGSATATTTTFLSNFRMTSGSKLVRVSLFLWTTFVLAGVVGALVTVLPYTALVYIILSILGVLGLGMTFYFFVEENGLIMFIPQGLQTLLFKTTLFEFLTDDRITKKIFAVIDDVTPLFLARTEEQRLEALANMAARPRRALTTKGLLHLMPTWLQTLVLPRHLNKHRREQPDAVGYRLARKSTSAAPNRVRRIVSQQSHLEGSARQMLQRTLAKRFVQEILNKANVELISKLVNPVHAKVGMFFFTAAMLLQIAFSTRSRETFRNILRALLLVGSSIGAGGSIAMYLLYKSAQHFKRADKALSRGAMGKD